ncbi:MAG: ATP-binding protein, partial [Alphaproteobacteria bacterium]|nr:ATP-binding protein [Alphaproteobacteria bacterium]
MKFTLSRPMLSISNFPSCDLPNFTLITGKNGVGKSHLLQAIESGAVIAEGVQAGQNQIVRYDWATMAPNDAGAFSSDSLNQERQPIVERIRATRDLVRNRAVQFLLEQSLGVPAKFSIDQFGPLISEAKLKTGSPQDEQIFTSIENELDQILNSQMNPQFGNWNTISQEICKKRGKRIYQLSSDDFDLESYPAWGGTSLFQQQLSRIFVLYHELRLANFARKGANQPHLSEQEFTERYGRAPWDYLNELLASNGIEFRINHPKQFVREPFIPRLTKINSNAEVQF